MLIHGAAAAANGQGAASIRSGGALDMVGPRHIVLGRDRSARISLSQPRAGPVRLHVNVGTISLATGPDPRGRLGATYTPPKARFPQLAVIVAETDDPDVFDWLAIPLHGQAKVMVESEPNVRAYVRVVANRFGPVQTNHAGRAHIKLVVPPGITTATVTAEDELGNVRDSPLRLNAPSPSRGLVVCPRVADRVRVFVADLKGGPDRDPRVELSTTAGSIGATRSLAPGVLVARYDPPTEITEAGTAEVTVRSKKAAGWSETCRMPAADEAPAGAGLTVNPPNFTAGGPSVRIFVRLESPSRSSPRSERVAMSVDLGEVSEIEQLEDGSYRAAWMLPDRFNGRQHATARLEVGTEVPLVVEATTLLVAGTPAALKAQVTRAMLRADGRSQTELEVTALDSYGNRTEVPEVHVSARGHVTPFTKRSDGTAVARYIAPRQYDSVPDQVVVSARDDDFSATVPVVLRAVPRRFLAAARLGYVTNLGRVSSPLVAADLFVRLPIWNERTLVGIETGYYSSAATAASDDGTENVALDVDGVPVLARAAYQHKLGPIDLHAGGGIGAILAGTSVASDDAGETSARDPRLTFGALLGAAHKIGPGRAVLETAYWHAPMEEGGVRGNVGGLALSGGYGLEW